MNKRILIVSKSQDMLELFRDILADRASEVVCMLGLTTCVKKIEEAQPSLLILDDLYGQNDPFRDLLYGLKLAEPALPMPVIALTTSREEKHELEWMLQERNVTILLKPFEIDELTQWVDSLLAGSAVLGARVN